MNEPDETATVGCRLTLAVTATASVVLQVSPARRPGLWVWDQLAVTLDGRSLLTQEIVDVEHGRQHIVEAEPGTLSVSYQGTVRRQGSLAAPAVTDVQRVTALRPSRYCPSDRVTGFARSHFGAAPTAEQRVRAICDYVWQHIGYESGTSGPSSDAVETLLAGRGVCRDFAHLVVTLCRAVDVPARVAAVYAPGLSPMDFHVVAETAIDGAWWSWDATRLAPRQSLVRIGTGRDAADIAFATVLSGLAELSTVEIYAMTGADLPLDNHEQRVALA
jgi:transglutaminase-like putative cysteine protease